MIIAWSFFRPFKVVFTGHRHRVLGWLLVPGKGLRVEVTELQVICVYMFMLFLVLQVER